MSRAPMPALYRSTVRVVGSQEYLTQCSFCMHGGCVVLLAILPVLVGLCRALQSCESSSVF